MKFRYDNTFKDGQIFVFGSNEAGRHGAGAAYTAMNKYGAEYGNGVGPQGYSYAIPTKDVFLHTLPLEYISQHVNDFILYATNNYQKEFFVTAIGTGLAGYSHEDIAPLFEKSPDNVLLPKEWKCILER